MFIMHYKVFFVELASMLFVNNCLQNLFSPWPTFLHLVFYYRPAEMFVNRLEVDNISVKNAIKLDSNHMVVVYKQVEGKIDSRIVRGPTIFIPDAHEW